VLGLHAWALLFDFEIEVTPSPAAMGFPDSLVSPSRPRQLKLRGT
jgi:hypothetical protein